MPSSLAPHHISAAACLFLLAAPLPVAALFQQFFPTWAPFLRDVLRDNCSAPLQVYQADPDNGKWNVIDCLLGAFSESRKAELAGAAVTLGLAPTILQAISPSSAETSVLFLRRPFLALLVSASSLAPSNPRDSRYVSPVDAFRIPPEVNLRPSFLAVSGPAAAVLVSAAEYVIAGLAAANIGLLAYQLGAWDFLSATNHVYDPTIVTYAALLIHAVGVVGLLLSVEVLQPPPKEGTSGRSEPRPGWSWSLERWLGRELVPSAYGEPLLLRPRRPNMLALFARWLLSIAPTLQLLFATIALSSSQLVGQLDARDILFRYLASAVLARAVLSYELAGLREVSYSSYPPEKQGARGEASSDDVRSGNTMGLLPVSRVAGRETQPQSATTLEIKSAPKATRTELVA